MLTLTLVRHAKSERGGAGLADFERPLNERGIKDAPRMGAWLLAEGIAPDLVLCSSSARTQATLDLIRPSLSAGVAVTMLKSLYLADEAVILRRLQRVPPTVLHVLMIGHNPGLQDLAVALAGRGAARATVADKFPTCGCAVLTVPVARWSEVAAGAARLVHWMTPRLLRA
jgi:phosphohistidine phosphatase